MTVRILIGDVREQLRLLPPDHFDCVVTSPPYWGLRDYGVAGQIGLEPTLGEHLAVMVDVFNEVRRVMKPTATLWLNYGDCYATKPSGRSAEKIKALGVDDRAFRDKPFSTIGPVFAPNHEAGDRRGGECKQRTHDQGEAPHTGRIVAGGTLKPKDLCMIPNRLAIALQDAGWWVRSEIVWGKPNPMPDSSGKYRPSTAHEKIFMLTKSGKHFYDAEPVAQAVSATTHARISQDLANQAGSARANGGRKTNGNMKAVFRKVAAPGSGIRNNASMDAALAIMPDTRFLRNYEPAPLEVWPMATQSFSDAHFATFPPELAERCIKAGCPVGGTVLDPFGGAGTTGLVADRLQRDVVLIELNPEYAAMAKRRIHGDSPLFVEAAE